MLSQLIYEDVEGDFRHLRDDGRTVGQANTDNLKFTKGSKEPTHEMNQGGDHGRGMNHGSNFGRGMNQGGDFGRGINRGGAHNQTEVPKSSQNKGEEI